MQITVVRSGSSCPLGEVLEHSEKVGPGGGGGSIYIYIYSYSIHNWVCSCYMRVAFLFRGLNGI